MLEYFLSLELEETLKLLHFGVFNKHVLVFQLFPMLGVVAHQVLSKECQRIESCSDRIVNGCYKH